MHGWPYQVLFVQLGIAATDSVYTNRGALPPRPPCWRMLQPVSTSCLRVRHMHRDTYTASAGRQAAGLTWRGRRRGDAREQDAHPLNHGQQHAAKHGALARALQPRAQLQEAACGRAAGWREGRGW